MRNYFSNSIIVFSIIYFVDASNKPFSESACPALLDVSCIPKGREDIRRVGGFEDKIANVPYVVSIQWNDFHFAVGTLVDESTVVTSAHAVKNVQPEDLPLYSVRVGSTNSRIGGQVINIATVYRHPDYVAYPPKNDIAVLKLEAPVIFGDGVQPAKLPKNHFEIQAASVSSKVFVWVTFSGWGLLNYKDRSCDELQTGFVPIIDSNICESLYGKRFDGENQLCTAEEARATCQGDSGSGLILDDVLLGVVTFSAACPNDQTPAQYLKVTAYLDFIKSYMTSA